MDSLAQSKQRQLSYLAAGKIVHVGAMPPAGECAKRDGSGGPRRAAPDKVSRPDGTDESGDGFKRRRNKEETKSDYSNQGRRGPRFDRPARWKFTQALRKRLRPGQHP